MVNMQVIVRRQDQKLYASITCMIRHHVARRAKVIVDHPHNAHDRTLADVARDIVARRLRLRPDPDQSTDGQA
jgi:hypothetical protein